MDALNIRLWIVFYLICFVAVLWATFLLVEGSMLWISLTLVTIVIGFNFIVILGEIRAHSRKKNALRQLLQSCSVIKEETCEED